MNLVEEQQKGHNAELLLNNPIFQEAIGKVKESIINSMSESAFGDEKTHNRLVIALQMLSQIEKQIKNVITTGKMAAIQAKGGAIMKIQGVA